MKKSPNRKRYENVAVWCNFLLFSEIFLILRCFVKGLYKILQRKLIPEKALAEKSQSSRFLTSFVKVSLCSFSSTPFLHSLSFAYFFRSGRKWAGYVHIKLHWIFPVQKTCSHHKNIIEFRLFHKVIILNYLLLILFLQLIKLYNLQ